MQRTHTDDEATLDGETQSHDLVNVSSANLKLNNFQINFWLLIEAI